jgi:hypothetical protein
MPSDEARPEMDDLLHDYFQAEMPYPWPTFKAPRPIGTTTTKSLWSRTSGRLALAASVASLVLGYLMLGTFFPRSQAPTDVQNVSPDIGLGNKTKKHAPTPPANQPDDPMPMPLPR